MQGQLRVVFGVFRRLRILLAQDDVDRRFQVCRPPVFVTPPPPLTLRRRSLPLDPSPSKAHVSLFRAVADLVGEGRLHCGRSVPINNIGEFSAASRRNMRSAVDKPPTARS